jgi:nitrate/nitrite transporter NarK
LSGTLVFLTRLTTFTDVVVYVCFSAAAGGIITVTFFSVWPALYGRRHLGSIQGAAQMMTVLASAVGPLLFAKVKNTTGSYDGALWGLAAITVVLAFYVWSAPTPPASTSTEPSSEPLAN